MTIQNFARACALATVLLTCGPARAIKSYRPTLDYLSSDFVAKAVNLPEPRARFCELELERAAIFKDLQEFVTQEAAYAAQIERARSALGRYDRFLDRTVMRYDYGDRVRPTKLIKGVRRLLKQAREDMARFDRDHETHVIDALRTLSYRFPRLIDQRDAYVEFATTIGAAIDVLVTAMEGLKKAESLATEPGLVAQARARQRRFATNQFLNKQGWIVTDMFLKAKHMHFDTPGYAGHMIDSSYDLVPYLQAAMKLAQEIQRDVDVLQKRVDLIVTLATLAGQPPLQIP